MKIQSTFCITCICLYLQLDFVLLEVSHTVCCGDDPILVNDGGAAGEDPIPVETNHRRPIPGLRILAPNNTILQ